MPREIWQFQSVGANDVISAYTSIAAASRKASAAALASETTRERKSKATSTSIVAASKSAEEKRWREIEKYGAKVAREAEKEAQARVRAEQRANQQIERERSRMLGRVAGRAANAVGGYIRNRISGAAGLVTDMFGASSGTEAVGMAVRNALATADIARRVSINARMPGQQAEDPHKLQKEFEATAIATPGIKATDIGEATQKYVDLTGDLKSAREGMATFATTASATGASVSDVAEAAASLGKQFDLKKLSDVQQTMAVLTAQGKGGAITMADMARQFQRLAAAGAAFGLEKGPHGITQLGGLLQVARSGTGTPRMAATATENVLQALTSKSGVLSKAGVHVYNKSGGKNDIYEVIAETLSKVGGTNFEKKNAELLKIFGKQGIRAINPLLGVLQTAESGKTGPEAQKAGYDAVLQALQNAAKSATNFGEVQQDAAQAQESASAKVEAAWQQLQSSVTDALLPRLGQFAYMAPVLVDAIGPLIDIFGALLDVSKSLAHAFAIISGTSEQFDEQERMRGNKKEARAKLAEMAKTIGPVSPDMEAQKAELEQVAKTGIKFAPASEVAKTLPNAPVGASGKQAGPEINTDPANTALDKFGQKLEMTAARLDKIRLDERPSVARNL